MLIWRVEYQTFLFVNDGFEDTFMFLDLWSSYYFEVKDKIRPLG